jgi:streptogramin lyase
MARTLSALIAAAILAGVNSTSAFARVGAITEFTLAPPADKTPEFIVGGPDGNLWFGLTNGSHIGRMTPSGAVSVFEVTTNPFVGGAQVEGVTVGPDGNIWFADSKCAIGRSSLSGSIAEFVQPTCGSPTSIASGSDGNLWFVDSSSSKIGRITTSGIFTMFTLPTPSAQPALITAGLDGNLWFTEVIGNAVARMTTAGTVTEFPLPTPRSAPYGITVGPDGNLWFTERTTQRIGRITPNGSITEYSISPAGSDPTQIVMGSDRRLWFTVPGSNGIGRMNTNGSGLRVFTLPHPNSQPRGITLGPPKNHRPKHRDVWFSEPAGNRVGEIATH